MPIPTDSEAEANHLGAMHRLRERAEQRRRNLLTQAAADLSSMEAQRMMQELQVYQIELEMQYEELLLAQSQTETLRQQYTDLYEFAPVGYVTLDARGLIQQLNLTACTLLGGARKRLVGRRFPLFVALDNRNALAEFLAQLATAEASVTCELLLQREDGTTFQGQLNGLAQATAAGQQLRLTLSDVTPRHTAVQALADSEARFRLLFEQSTDAILLTKNLRIIDCNVAAMRLIGAQRKEQLIGQHISLLTPERQPNGHQSLDLIEENLHRAKVRGSYRFEWLRRRFTGEEIWLEVVLTAMQMQGETVVHTVWRDITTQHEAREQLRHERDFTRSLLDNSIDGILALDGDMRVTAWNRVMEQHTTLRPEQVLGRNILEVFPAYRTGPEEEAIRLMLTGEQFVRYNLSFQSSPGAYESYLGPLVGEDGTVNGGLVLIRDVTERLRLTEEATNLKLRQQKEVLSAILTTQEEERRRIAEALHNGVGQLLYATKLNMENRANPTFREASLALLDEAIKATRTISFELTPGILEDFGLETAIEELVKRIPSTSLDVQCHLAGLKEVELPRLLEIAVYRIVQELLNNILKHAHAQEAFLHVVHENGHVYISMEDNGVGFDSALLGAPTQGIGMASIRNRIELLGGTLSIDSRPGRGTITAIELPVNSSQ